VNALTVSVGVFKVFTLPAPDSPARPCVGRGGFPTRPFAGAWGDGVLIHQPMSSSRTSHNAGCWPVLTGKHVKPHGQRVRDIRRYRSAFVSSGHQM